MLLVLFDRSAIEEELEVLYDAYYDELESYALHQVRYANAAPGTIAPPPGPGPFPGSVDAATTTPATAAPPAKKHAGIVKPTRDHKNVRPAAKKKPPPSSTVANAGHGNHHGHHHHHDGPAHGEPGHTHSPSCPHHPHNHGTTPNAQAKAKGTAVEEHYDDEEGDEEDEEDDEEYDDDEYDDEEDDEDYDDEDDVGQDGDPQQQQQLPTANIKSNKTANAKLNNNDPSSTDADFFGFGKSLTVKGEF